MDPLRLEVQNQPDQHGETPSLLKIQKIIQAWWGMPVIPATQETEAGELLEPKRRRFWRAKIVLWHPAWAKKARLCLKKKKKEYFSYISLNRQNE